MTVGAYLDALRDLPLASLATITGGAPLAVLSPHPDDESLGAGGLIAAACSAAQRVDVIVLSDGAGSHPRSTAYPRDRLVALRRREAAEATALLGLPAGRLHHLDLPDTRVPLRGPDFDSTVERLAALLAEAGTRTLLVTWGHDPHCDHEAADAIARSLRRRRPALRLLAYPIWGWHRDPEEALRAPPPTGFRFDVTPWLGRKRAAIAAHASQMTDLIDDDPEGFRFEARTLAPVLGDHEVFIEVPA